MKKETVCWACGELESLHYDEDWHEFVRTEEEFEESDKKGNQ